MLLRGLTGSSASLPEERKYPDPLEMASLDTEVEGEDEGFIEILPMKKVRRRDFGTFRQFRTMLKVEFKQRSRNWAKSLCLIFVPLLVLSILGLVWSLSLQLSKPVTSPAEIHANQTAGIESIFYLLQKFAPFCNIRDVRASLFAREVPQCDLSSGDYCISENVCIDSERISVDDLLDIYESDGPLPIPSFDAFVASAKIIEKETRNGNDTTFEKRYPFLYNLVNFGKLYFSPDTEQVRELMTYMNSTYVFFNDVFGGVTNDTSSIISRGANPKNASDRIWALVEFNQFDVLGKDVDYAIRMNYTAIPTTKKLYNDYNSGFDPSYKLYLISGFSSLQQAIEVFVLSKSLVFGNGTLGSFVSVEQAAFMQVPMPTPQTTSVSPIWKQFGPFAGLFITLSISYSFSMIVKNIVEHKEHGILDLLKISGLRLRNWALAVAIFDLLSCILIAILGAAILALSIVVKSQYLALLSIAIVFFFTLVPLAFMISALFKRSAVAAIGAPLLLFIMVLPRYAFFDSARGDNNWLTKSLICLLSPAAFAFQVDILMSFEAGGIGLSFSQFSLSYFGIGRITLIMFVDIWLYFFLAWFFNRVLPAGLGNSFRLFKNTWRKWKPKRYIKSFGTLSEANPNVEPVARSIASKVVISIQNLYKRFRSDTGETVTAVNNLNLEMYEGQITALLGHNSAGKSTTISILTGLLGATSGEVLIDGYSSLDEYENQISFGLCPQKDIMFSKLTVREHLLLFGVVKGIPESSILREIERIVKATDLWNFQNHFVDTLSGGTRRKLAVAMAIIGKPRVLVLDEPTAAMDPYSRRKIWDLLQRYKPNRVTILTTHFLDEADYLGDRIAFMSKGSLYCAGSSLFLKSRFGVGYSLTMSSESESALDPDDVLPIVKRYVPEAELSSCAPKEIIFKLPFTASDQFPGLFDFVESRGVEYGIGTIGLSVTTLEEVFLRIAINQERPEQSLPEEEKDLSVPSRNKLPEILRLNQSIRDSGKMKPSYLVQCYALLWKRFMSLRSDWRSKLAEMIGTWLVITLSFLIISSNIEPQGPPLLLSGDAFGRISVNGFTVSPSDVPYSQSTTSPAQVTSLDEFGNGLATLPRSEVDSFNMSFWLLDTARDNSGSRYIAYLPRDDVLTRTSFASDSESTSAPTDGPFSMSILQNATCLHSIPIGSSEWTSASYRNLLNDSSARYQISSHPLPAAATIDVFIQNFLAIFASLFILLPMSYLPAVYVVFSVRERTTRSQQIQFMSGLPPALYWMMQYVWDFLNYFVVASGVVILLAIFFASNEYSALVLGPLRSGYFFRVLVLYGAAVIPFSYLISLLYDNPRTAQISVTAIHFVTGFVLVICSYILDEVDSTAPVNSKLKYLYRLFPTFNLGETLISLATLPTRNFWERSDLTPEEVVRPNLRYLGWEAIVFALVLILIHIETLGLCAKKIQRGITRKIRKVPPFAGENEDEDVILERERIAQIRDLDNQTVFFKHMWKIYGVKNPKVVVRDLNLAISRGECFGLLGVNAAGKTTTMKILTGETFPSLGVACVLGKSVDKDPAAIHRNIGYCPQWDPVIDSLTGKEHIKFYAMLRGIPFKFIDEAANEIIHLLGMEFYANKLVENYSGGNKRKISLGIALVGSPPLIILDEPSAGMDPMAKRRLWKAVIAVKRSRTVILTTHCKFLPSSILMNCSYGGM